MDNLLCHPGLTRPLHFARSNNQPFPTEEERIFVTITKSVMRWNLSSTILQKDPLSKLLSPYSDRKSFQLKWLSCGATELHWEFALPDALHLIRFGKSTHISKISNSVTHLRSYTNSAIAGNSAPISPVTPRDRRRRRADVSASSADVAAPNADVSTSSADVSASSANIVALNDDYFMMFHNVLSVSWCFTSGSLCYTMFYMCFMMFYYV